MDDILLSELNEEQKQIIKVAIDAAINLINAVIEAVKAVATCFVEFIKALPPINTKALHIARHAKKWRTRKKNAKRIFDTRRNTQNVAIR